MAVDGQLKGRIGRGMVVLLGIGRTDSQEAVKLLADKILGLRIFEDGDRAMNLSIGDVGGEVLLVSQFTLYGDCRHGRRPNFIEAAPPAEAEALYHRFADHLRASGFAPQEGVFGARMLLSLVNDGPVTMLLDSERRF